jgi:hypothetical protein
MLVSTPSRDSLSSMFDFGIPGSCNIEVVRKTHRVAQQKFQGVVPFRKSQWFAFLKPYWAPHGPFQDNSGELTRSNIMTGGIIRCAHEIFLKALPLKALDIRNGVVLVDGAVASNAEGINMFFEIDYQSDVALPPPHIIVQHISLAFECVRKAFPSVPAAKFQMTVSICQPKLKKKRQVELAAFGVHLVFPGIVVKTDVMYRLTAYLNQEITRKTPEWGDVVDAQPIKKSLATLRPNGSHKADECSVCVLNKKSHTGRQPSTATTDFQLVCPPECVRGKIVQASVYRLTAILKASDQGGYIAQLKPRVSVLLELQLTSISPAVLGRFTPGFQENPDIPSSLDSAPRPDGYAKGSDSDSQQFCLPTGSNMIVLHPQRHKMLIDLIWSLVCHSFPWYSSSQVKVVEMKNEIIFVKIKNQFSHACICLGNVHSSNSVFFKIRLKAGCIEFGCFDKECKQFIRQSQKQNKYQSTTVTPGRSAFPLGTGLTEVFLDQHLQVVEKVVPKLECFSHKIMPKALSRLLENVKCLISVDGVRPSRSGKENSVADATHNSSLKNSKKRQLHSYEDQKQVEKYVKHC